MIYETEDEPMEALRWLFFPISCSYIDFPLFHFFCWQNAPLPIDSTDWVLLQKDASFFFFLKFILSSSYNSNNYLRRQMQLSNRHYEP